MRGCLRVWWYHRDGKEERRGNEKKRKENLTKPRGEGRVGKETTSRRDRKGTEERKQKKKRREGRGENERKENVTRHETENGVFSMVRFAKSKGGKTTIYRIG